VIPLILIVGIPVLYTSGDYYKEIISHIHKHRVHGLLTDNGFFALLNPPRLFAAHDLKLTYKGSLETKEYNLEKWMQQHKLTADRLPLLGCLLGTCDLGVNWLTSLDCSPAGG